jgi:hypothetical protein
VSNVKDSATTQQLSSRSLETMSELSTPLISPPQDALAPPPLVPDMELVAVQPLEEAQFPQDLPIVSWLQEQAAARASADGSNDANSLVYQCKILTVHVTTAHAFWTMWNLEVTSGAPSSIFPDFSWR